MSTQSFADLGASRPVVDALTHGGMTAVFPVQSLVLPDALAGSDVLVKSPTGSTQPRSTISLAGTAFSQSWLSGRDDSRRSRSSP